MLSVYFGPKIIKGQRKRRFLTYLTSTPNNYDYNGVQKLHETELINDFDPVLDGSDLC